MAGERVSEGSGGEMCKSFNPGPGASIVVASIMVKMAISYPRSPEAGRGDLRESALESRGSTCDNFRQDSRGVRGCTHRLARCRNGHCGLDCAILDRLGQHLRGELQGGVSRYQGSCQYLNGPWC